MSRITDYPDISTVASNDILLIVDVNDDTESDEGTTKTITLSQLSSQTGGDKNYIQEFNTTDTVTVTHNLAKYPAVMVVDSAYDVVEGDIIFTSLNTLTVSFSAPFSGTVTCN